ncbi:hypothetical protein NX059_001706 [Plenodomus lindquistii]|nr:hypothetical protein NX059_001706 [Plenodomus lindquistii]
MPTRPARKNARPLIRPGGVSAPKVNTTNFPFWPQTGTHNAQIPNHDASINEVFGAGTLLPDPADGTWEGARKLGAGAYGKVYLWVKTDDNNNVVDRMAIKDFKNMRHKEWTNPVAWRDNLPREIAVGERLTAQGHAGIARLRGYRLNMGERRYRQYLDFSDFHDLYRVLFPYVQDHHPEVRDGAQTIPEPFIWYVFRSLLDALFVFRDGNNQPLTNGDHWKPIVHLDLTLNNIFVMPAVDDDGNAIHPDYGRPWPAAARNKTVDVFQTHWPRLQIGDFDKSMFPLQDTTDPANPDAYADNPGQYIMRGHPLTQDDGGGRYPPELFEEYYRRQPGPPQPLTSASDVWALGQVLWPLLTNFIHGSDWRPRWELDPIILKDDERDHPDSARYFICNGHMYGDQDLDEHLFRDGSIGGSYSDDLKRAVRACLRWDPATRPGLEGLRNLVNRATRTAGPGLVGADGGRLRLRVPADLEEHFVGAKRHPTVVKMEP